MAAFGTGGSAAFGTTTTPPARRRYGAMAPGAAPGMPSAPSTAPAMARSAPAAPAGPTPAGGAATGVPAGYTPPPPVQRARADAQAATGALGTTPNRQQLAAETLALARESTAEGYQRDLQRGAGVQAAMGRVGSGMAETAVRDITLTRERDLDRLARDVSLTAAQSEFSDRLARAQQSTSLASVLGGEARADEGLRIGREESAAERALQRELQANTIGFQREDAAAGRALQGELGRGDLALRRDTLGFQREDSAAQRALQAELGRGDLGLRGQQLTQQGRQFDQDLGFRRESLTAGREDSAAERALRSALQTQSLEFQGNETYAERALRAALQGQELTFRGQEGAADRGVQQQRATLDSLMTLLGFGGRVDPATIQQILGAGGGGGGGGGVGGGGYGSGGGGRVPVGGEREREEGGGGRTGYDTYGSVATDGSGVVGPTRPGSAGTGGTGGVVGPTRPGGAGTPGSTAPVTPPRPVLRPNGPVQTFTDWREPGPRAGEDLGYGAPWERRVRDYLELSPQDMLDRQAASGQPMQVYNPATGQLDDITATWRQHMSEFLRWNPDGFPTPSTAERARWGRYEDSPAARITREGHRRRAAGLPAMTEAEAAQFGGGGRAA